MRTQTRQLSANSPLCSRYSYLRAGRIRTLPPPVDPARFADATNSMHDLGAVGPPATVRAQLQYFVERTRADELITVTYAYDPALRNRSIELLADLWL
ncbi:hypothetical protein [Dietzia sp. KRD202]|uniref:hypothetical protein n=1 Tax=Dietzia sp. KRD202 TaxID=2729732 RepID=UPI0019D02A2B|nr:hypothetical protein [Dietzia sp. KRD202]